MFGALWRLSSVEFVNSTEDRRHTWRFTASFLVFCLNSIPVAVVLCDKYATGISRVERFSTSTWSTSQVEEYSQTANDAWQGAVARASAAENQARQFETIISSLQEQLHADQVHKQLTSPERSDIPTAQGAADPIDDHSTCHSPYHSCRNDRIPPESTGIHWNETGIRRNANQFHRNATGIHWNRYELPYLGAPLT